MAAAPPARFPAVALPALAGEPRDLSRVQAATLVMLGHGECGTTRLLLPYLERIHRGRAAGTEVVAVLQDSPEDARALARELGLSLPVLLDPAPWPLGTALSVQTVPLTLLLRAGGAVELAFPAFRRDEVEQAASRLGVSPLFSARDVAPALRPG